MFKKKEVSVATPIPTTLETLKQKIRILIIDDKENDLIQSLKDHHWRVRYQTDLVNVDDQDVLDSHIILVDVKGVGKKLGFKYEGLDVASFLKKRYPEKKIVLYSTIEDQKAFHEAFQIVDKVMYKDGSLAPFLSLIEDLAREIGDWDPMVKYVYNKVLLPNGIKVPYEEVNSKLIEIISDDKHNPMTVERGLGIASNIATVVFGILSLFSGVK